eukprot:1156916-Pelagomonas_calceolata.AAC.3
MACQKQCKKGFSTWDGQTTEPESTSDDAPAAKPLFEGHRIPPISLKDYVIRIWNYTKVSISIGIAQS